MLLFELLGAGGKSSTWLPPGGSQNITTTHATLSQTIKQRQENTTKRKRIKAAGPPALGSGTRRFLLLFNCCMWCGCSGYDLYYVMCCCVFFASQHSLCYIVFVLCDIIDHVIVMLVSACVFFMLVHLLWICAWLWILFLEFFTSVFLGTRPSISFQQVGVDVSILFGVVRDCCHRFSLLSLLIMH